MQLSHHTEKQQKIGKLAQELKDARNGGNHYDFCGICSREWTCERFCGYQNFKRGIISSFIRKMKEKIFHTIDSI
jgi:hypothetical protein